jgi:hypothetical protein
MISICQILNHFLEIRATRNETTSIGLIPALRECAEGAFSAARLSSEHHFRCGGLRAFVRLNTTSDAIPTRYRCCTDAFVYGGLSRWVDFASKERPQSFNETLHFIASRRRLKIFIEEYHLFSEPLLPLSIRDGRISTHVFHDAPIPVCSVMKSRTGSPRSSFSSSMRIPETRCSLFQRTTNAVLSFFTALFHCSFITLVSRFQQGSATLNTVNHHCLQESEKRPHGK